MDWKAFDLRIISALHNIVKNAAPASVSVTFSKWKGAPEWDVEALEEFEKKRGKRVPESFRRALLEYSSSFECSWSILGEDDRNYAFEDELGVSMGEISWSVEELKKLNAERDDFRSSDGWADPWENKLPFYCTGGGDMLAIDTSVDDGAVFYLSTRGEDALDNVPLGKNFLDFLDRASRIAFADAESYHSGWASAEKGLDLGSKKARRLRKKLRID